MHWYRHRRADEKAVTMNDALTPGLPDFDDPLGVLQACHERMLEHCDILQNLVSHIAQNGVDSEARSAINKVTRYFNTSAVQHHQDEEENLFPLLNRQSLKLAEIIYRLNQEHKELSRLWDLIHAALKKPATLADDTEFAAHVEQFCSSYREHIDYENKELLGMARHIISSKQLKDIGDAMARRRGIRR